MSRSFSDDDLQAPEDEFPQRSAHKSRRKLDDGVMFERSCSTAAAFQPNASLQIPEESRAFATELRADADTVFDETEKVVEKLDSMLKMKEFGNYDIRTSLIKHTEEKIAALKSVLKSRGPDVMFDILNGEVATMVQLSRSNSILASENAELTANLIYARDATMKKQTDGILKLKETVKKAIDLGEEKEMEALKYKKKYELLVVQNKTNNNNLKAKDKELEDERRKITDLGKEKSILQNNLDNCRLQLADKEEQLRELSEDKHKLENELRSLMRKVEQTTVEMVQLEGELRKKNEYISGINARYDSRVDEICSSAEKKANEHIKMTTKMLVDKHEAAMKELNAKLSHTENEKEMANRRADDMQKELHETLLKVEQLRANAQLSDRQARAKCLRKVMTAITDNGNDSSSGYSDLYLPTFGRSSENSRPRTTSESVGHLKRVAFESASSAKVTSPRKKHPK